MHVRTTAEYIDSLPMPHPLVMHPGFSISMFKPDYMHADLLGQRLHIVGSVLLQLCEESIFGVSLKTVWKEPLQERLDRASQEFRRWLTSKKKTCQFYGFSVAGLHLVTRASWPWLKVKAVTSEMVSEWLLDIHLQRSLFDTHYGKVRASMLWGFCEAYNIFSTHDCLRFSDEQIASLVECRKAALNGLHFLSSSAYWENKPLYKLLPKLHSVDKIFRSSIKTRRNPATYWCFSEEDAVGSFAKLANACHTSSVCKRTPERWLLYYFALFSKP